jgi:hypothetical protein
MDRARGQSLQRQRQDHRKGGGPLPVDPRVTSRALRAMELRVILTASRVDGATMSDDERPRKSWREIDKAKDRSAHRKEERPAFEGKRGGVRSQKTYRAALDRLFESGKISELVGKETSADGAPAGGSRIRMLARIEKAVDRETICKEVDAYLQEHDLPDDIDILGKVLEHRDPALQRQAMERIDRLLEQGKPKRQRAMVAQLKLIRDTGYDEEGVQLAKKLLERLG